MLAKLVGYAVRYYQDFVKPSKRYRAPTAAEETALKELAGALDALPDDAPAETIQNEVYEVGKRHPQSFADLRSWFKALYEILLGQEQGPRWGSFFALYGLPSTRKLIQQALAGELVGVETARV